MKPHDEMDAFESPAAELEARIAEASARGDAVPPEAYAMLSRLRELMDAIKGLNATVGGDDDPDAGAGSDRASGAAHTDGAATRAEADRRPPAADGAARADDVDTGRADR